MSITDYLTQSGNTIYLHRNKIHEVSVSLGLPKHGQLTHALGVLRLPGNRQLRSPDTRLMGIMTPSYVNLSKLHHYLELPFFEWSYSRYRHATQSRLELIKRFDMILTVLGVFDED